MSDFRYIVKKEDEGQTVKEMIRNRFGFSSRLSRKLKNEGSVLLNNATVRLWHTPKSGDEIFVTLPEETSHFTPENIPISVVYEDEDILVINKQPGVVVHPTKGTPSGTIANGLMPYMEKTKSYFKIRFVNRLDRDTSGLLIIAKNAYSQENLVQQMKSGKVNKKYVSVVHGIVSEEEGTIDLPIGREGPDAICRKVREDGYPSVTHYKVLNRLSKGYTYLELQLETGRTHQIRVHLSHIGYPIVADMLYGKGEEDHSLIERQALHAKYLSFFHPRKGNLLELNAELPNDFHDLLQKVL